MFDILMGNYFLWLNIVIPISFAIYLAITNDKYSWKEFAIQVVATTVVLFITLALFFRFGTNMYTTHYENGAVTKFIYAEEWDELVHYTQEHCSGSGNSRMCYTTYHTRVDHHSADYDAIDSRGLSFSVNESDYFHAKSKFGDTMVDDGHGGQVSRGDGRTFESYPTEVIPTVTEVSSVNYIHASASNVIKSNTFRDLEKQYSKELVKYPELTYSSFGTPTIPRVINSHIIINPVNLNKFLSDFASLHGSDKQINPMIYLTTSKNREFTSVIKGYYADKHQNDVILVLGVDNGIVVWSDVIAYTKNAEFYIECTKFKDYNLNDTNSTQILLSKYDKLLKDKFKRTSMKEFKYLSNEIDISLWSQVFIILFNLVLSFFTFRFFLKNDI